MSEDFSIKLFGKTIQVGSKINEDFVGASVYEPSSAAVDRDDFESDCQSTCDQNLLCSKQDKNRVNEENIITKEAMETKQEGEQSSTSVLDEPKTPNTPSTDTEKPKTCNTDTVCSSQNLAIKNQDQSDQASSDSDSQDQNPLKKPDEIIPCARCNSMDTKFCYYNNYNVNQPRHFCRSCQRYWTAGGSMRNVPVGAGRRKNKNSAAAQYSNLLIPGASDGLIHPMMRPDGTILAFGNDNSTPNSNNSSLSFSNPNMIPLNQTHYNGGTMANSQPIPFFPYSWNPVSLQSGFPASYYTAPAPQWGDSIPAGPCNLQWVPTQSLNSDQSSTSSSLNNSTSLGKHPREGWTFGSSSTDNNESYNDREFENSRFVMPRTLSINDPVEASRSSIWTTLGANNNNYDNGSSSIGRVAFFGGLQQAKEGNNYERINNMSGVEASSMALQANPAAFSRSLAFHEIAQ